MHQKSKEGIARFFPKLEVPILSQVEDHTAKEFVLNGAQQIGRKWREDFQTVMPDMARRAQSFHLLRQSAIGVERGDIGIAADLGDFHARNASLAQRSFDGLAQQLRAFAVHFEDAGRNLRGRRAKYRAQSLEDTASAVLARRVKPQARFHRGARNAQMFEIGGRTHFAGAKGQARQRRRGRCK